MQGEGESNEMSFRNCSQKPRIDQAGWKEECCADKATKKDDRVNIGSL